MYHALMMLVRDVAVVFFMNTPSIMSSTLLTPTEQLPFAVILTSLITVCPLFGYVMLMVGGIPAPPEPPNLVVQPQLRLVDPRFAGVVTKARGKMHAMVIPSIIKRNKLPNFFFMIRVLLD